MVWTDIGIRTLELLPNLFNSTPATILLFDIEEVIQGFDNNPQSNYLLDLLAGQVNLGLGHFWGFVTI